jgi:hypothetical protein
MLTLGPIPEAVRCTVQRLIAESRPEPSGCDERLNGFFLCGGPGGCSYLDAEGQVWNWSVWDESIEPVPDGPVKVGLVAIAAVRVPELAAWLPARPAGATDCDPCQGSGWLPPPLNQLLCPKCHGMGWVPPRSDA